MTRGTPADGRRQERGSVTIPAVAFVVLLVSVALLGVAITGLIAGQRRADAAADLAALAGASALQNGEPACPAAGRIAEANGSLLVSCAVDGETVRLEVSVNVDSAFQQSWQLRSEARAGPVS